MQELDLLLMRYMDRHYQSTRPAERAAFETLLKLQDPEILALLTGRAVAEDKHLRHVVERLLNQD